MCTDLSRDPEPRFPIAHGSFRIVIKLLGNSCESPGLRRVRPWPDVRGSVIVTGTLGRSDAFHGRITSQFSGQFATRDTTVTYSARLDPGASWKAHR